MARIRTPAGAVCAAGLFLGSWTGSGAAVPILAAALIAALVHIKFRTFLTATILTLALCTMLGSVRKSQPLVLTAGPQVLAAKILQWAPGEDGVRAVLRPVGSGSTAAVRAFLPRQWGRVPASSWVKVAGDVSFPKQPTNPGERTFQDPFFFADKKAAPRWGPGGKPKTIAFRQYLVRNMQSRLPGFPARLGEAMILGRGYVLGQSERRVFRDTGVSHLTAVSGLHVGLIAALSAVVLTPFSRTWGLWGAGVMALSYAGLAGWSPSATRAAIMALAISLGLWAKRGRPLPDVLFMAAAIMLWLRPEAWQSLSFILSFSAVGGILYALDVAPKISKAAAVIVSLGAQWGTLPVMVQVFGAWPPFSLIPNLFAIPLAGVFLPSAVLTAVLPFDGLSALPAAAANGSAALLAATLDAAGLLPVLRWIPLPPPWALFPIPLLWTLGLLIHPSKKKSFRLRCWGGALAAAAALLLFVPRQTPPGPWVAFLDVGQGDAAVFHSHTGDTWLVDVGDDRGPSDTARRVVLPYLRHRGIRRIAGWIVSHPHRDHVGSAPSLLETIPIETVYATGKHLDFGTGKLLSAQISKSSVPLRFVTAGDHLVDPDAYELRVVFPDTTHTDYDVNNASLVVRAQDGPLEVLFTGDIELQGEGDLTASPWMEQTMILKAGHHGSATSSSPAVLERAAPKWAVISSGQGNRYGHPDPEILNRLTEYSIQPLRTDQLGSVEFFCRESTLVLRRGREP